LTDLGDSLLDNTLWKTWHLRAKVCPPCFDKILADEGVHRLSVSDAIALVAATHASAVKSCSFDNVGNAGTSIVAKITMLHPTRWYVISFKFCSSIAYAVTV
jgi:hypothetical protein